MCGDRCRPGVAGAGVSIETRKLGSDDMNLLETVRKVCERLAPLGRGFFATSTKCFRAGLAVGKCNNS